MELSYNLSSISKDKRTKKDEEGGKREQMKREQRRASFASSIIG
jgi:uncharacterized membrane-anchored protein